MFRLKKIDDIDPVLFITSAVLLLQGDVKVHVDVTVRKTCPSRLSRAHESAVSVIGIGTNALIRRVRYVL